MAWHRTDSDYYDQEFFYDSKGNVNLDNFGYPDIAVANSILLKTESLGESKDDLEETWEKWVHHIPFDAQVSRMLVKLYSQRLEKLDKEKNAADYQRLKRKLDLVQHRANRYDIERFSHTN